MRLTDTLCGGEVRGTKPHDAGAGILSRRDALRLLLGAGAGVAATGLSAGPLAKVALAVTQSDVDKTEGELSEAQAQLDAAQAQIDEISIRYEELSEQQSQTLDQIEQTQGKIDDLEAKIADEQERLEAKQEILSRRVAASYKSGGNDFLDLLMSATSIEELVSGVYYMGKITAADKENIDAIQELKAQLEQQKAELESQKSELEALSAQQQEQLAEMQRQQEEVQAVIDGLSQDVRDLMARRDEELEAMAAERARQEAAAAAARQNAAVANTLNSGNTTGSQTSVLAACTTTPSPGVGLCAMWVSQVFSRAGFAYASGNANDMYNAWCTSTDRSYLQPGMIVAVSTHPHTLAGRIYGHIGIYVGGGMMMDNVGYVRTISLDEWIAYYGSTVAVRWGWLMGITLA